jgi:multidrug efflux pump subunit AcrA (membrane-fusion protein)
MKKIITVIVIIILVILGIFIIKKPKNAPIEKKEVIHEEGITIDVTRAKIGSIKNKISAIGVITPWHQVNAYSKASGKISQLLFDEGDYVKQNDTVAYVDRDEPGFEFSKLPVKSPVSGIILKRFVDIGSQVTPAVQSVSMATPIFLIGEIENVKIQISVIEQDLGKIKENQITEITTEAYPNTKFIGKVFKISPSADPISHSAKVEIILNNKEHLLKPGISANVDIITGEHKNVLLIPRIALIKKLGEEFVYVIEEKTVHKRNVKTGYDDGEFIEIIHGIKANEFIAISDLNVLQDGMKVIPKEIGK